MNLENVRLKFDRRRAFFKYNVTLVLLAVCLAAQSASSQTQEIEPGEGSGLVELQLSADPDASYKQRRSPWSKRFSVTYEAMVPTGFESPIDGQSYEALFDLSYIPLLCLNFGAQYNSKIGGLFADLTYGGGAISNVSGSTGDSITLTKMGLNFGILFDTFFENPYVSPFVSMQTVIFDWSEYSSGSSSTMSGQTAISVGFTFGASFHLEKFDRKTSGRAYVEYGIKNSFIDIYASVYQPSIGESDPNFETSMNVAAALRFEF